MGNILIISHTFHALFQQGSSGFLYTVDDIQGAPLKMLQAGIFALPATIVSTVSM